MGQEQLVRPQQKYQPKQIQQQLRYIRVYDYRGQAFVEGYALNELGAGALVTDEMDNLYAVDYDFIQTLANRRSNEVGYLLENHMFNDECLDRVAPSSMDAVIEIAFSQGSGRGRR